MTRLVTRTAAASLVVLALSACTTVQTTYFRNSYVALGAANDASLVPYEGQPGFEQVAQMRPKVRDMYGKGYVMLGYSQFVSPLLTNLAPSYSTKYGEELRAAYVVLENPVRGASNLHGYLVTYWARTRTDQYAIGVYVQDLPEDLLQRIGEEFNVVLIQQVIPETPAARGGLQENDVVLALDGVGVLHTREFLKTVNERRGKRVTVSVSRKGERLDLPVDVVTPVRHAGAKAFAFHEDPWVDTKPTDWSSLSAANISADVARQQQQERLRQQEYEKARADFARNPAYASSPQHLDERTARARGLSTGAGKNPVDMQALAREQAAKSRFQDSFMANYNSPAAQKARERQQSVDIWFQNAPNVYGQLFQFPRPRAP